MKSLRMLDKIAARRPARLTGLCRDLAMLALAVAVSSGVAFAQQNQPKPADRPGAGHGMMMGPAKGDMMCMHAQMMTDMGGRMGQGAGAGRRGRAWSS